MIGIEYGNKQRRQNGTGGIEYEYKKYKGSVLNGC